MIYPVFVAPVLFAIVLGGFVVVHVLAAFYRQVVKKDGLFPRDVFRAVPPDFCLTLVPMLAFEREAAPPRWSMMGS